MEKIMKSLKEMKMKSTFARCITAMTLLAALTISLPLSAQIIEFEAPGAGTGAYQGTIATDINSAGRIIGNYVLPNNAFQAYMRTPKGKFTTFNAPGAGTGANQGTSA